MGRREAVAKNPAAESKPALVRRKHGQVADSTHRLSIHGRVLQDQDTDQHYGAGHSLLTVSLQCNQQFSHPNHTTGLCVWAVCSGLDQGAASPLI